MDDFCIIAQQVHLLLSHSRPTSGRKLMTSYRFFLDRALIHIWMIFEWFFAFLNNFRNFFYVFRRVQSFRTALTVRTKSKPWRAFYATSQVAQHTLVHHHQQLPRVPVCCHPRGQRGKSSDLVRRTGVAVQENQHQNQVIGQRLNEICICCSRYCDILPL